MALDYLKKILMSGLNVNKKGTLEEELDSLGTGGGGADAVKYTPQELTEEQIKQTRKNLGLYWSESNRIEWDGDTTGRITIAIEDMIAFYKVSDNVLTQSDLVGATITMSDGESAPIPPEYIQEIADGVIMGGGSILSARAGTYDCSLSGYSFSLTVPEDGVYFAIEDGQYYITRLIHETASKIEEKFIPDSIARADDVVKSYVFERPLAPWNEIVTAATEFQNGRATMIWNEDHVVEAFVEDDIVWLRFAKQPYRLLGYTDSDNIHHSVSVWVPDQYRYDLADVNEIYFMLNEEHQDVGRFSVLSDNDYVSASGKFVFDKNSLIITASDNSSKHFKITVNSEGVLSATEVTSEP